MRRLLPLISVLLIAGFMEDPRDTAIKNAMDSVRQAALIAAKDPGRPVFHFRPPANWMNDPNGPIFSGGELHLFYQHNPYGDKWGHMHWGHAKSRDMVHWEQLPIALWPSLEAGEEHCFSGTAAAAEGGKTMLFYTSVAPAGGRANEQWTAFSSGSLLTWEKGPHNPLLRLGENGVPSFGREWRDPFIFRADGAAYMVLGADTESEAVIPIFKAESAALDQWKYLGVLFRKPKSEIEFFECPNFFQVDGRWVLITSPYRRLEYWVGDFDAGTPSFTPERHGILDYGAGESANFYASNIVYTPDQRCILLGWVRGFPEGKGWNGCLALPREVHLDAEGNLLQTPVRELVSLRKKAKFSPLLTLDSKESRLAGVPTSELEMSFKLRLKGATSAGVRFIGPDGSKEEGIAWNGRTLTVAGSEVPYSGDELSLTLFRDRTVLEVFGDGGRIAVTRVLSIPKPSGLTFFADNGSAEFDSVKTWSLTPIWNP